MVSWVSESTLTTVAVEPSVVLSIMSPTRTRQVLKVAAESVRTVALPLDPAAVRVRERLAELLRVNTAPVHE